MNSSKEETVLPCDSKELFVQQFCIKIKHLVGQNQRTDTPADFTVLC